MSYASQKIIKNTIFLKVEQGTPHTIRLIDEDPTEQWQHKIDGKLTICGGESCVYCDEGHSRNQRFVANVYDHTDGRVMLWSYGPSVAGILKTIDAGLQKDGLNILEHDLEVSVTGSGLQKKTNVQLKIKSQAVPSGIKKHKIGAKPEEIPF